MFCPNCGKEISDKIRFCPYCGESILEECEEMKENEKKKEVKEIEVPITEEASNQNQSENIVHLEKSTEKISSSKLEKKKQRKEEKRMERLKKKEEDLNQKSNFGAILFSVFTACFIVYALVVHILERSFDSQFLLLLILLAADCILLLCSIYPQKRMQIIRGITLLVLVETFLIANMSGIEKCIENIEDTAKIETVVMAVWYATIVLWLLFEGAKAIFCAKSENMAAAETILVLVNFLCAILSVLYEANLYTGDILFSISQRDLILKTAQFYVLAAFLVSNMFLSWKSTKRK